MGTDKSLIHTLAAVVVSLLLACGCQQAEVSTTAVKSPAPVHLRVGVTSNAPPLIFKQKEGFSGLESALARQLGAYLDRKVVFVEVPWDEQFDYLTSGKTDIIMSGLTITQNRRYIADFTKPYMRSGQILLIRMEDMQRFSTGLSSVMNTNHPIGTVKGTVSDFLVTAAIVGANETAYSSPQKAVEALIKKEIDLFLYDAPIICYYAAQYQSDKLVPVLSMATEEYLGWAVRKGDTELLEGANSFLDSIEKNGRLTQEIKHWIPYLYR